MYILKKKKPITIFYNINKASKMQSVTLYSAILGKVPSGVFIYAFFTDMYNFMRYKFFRKIKNMETQFSVQDVQLFFPFLP